jgi:hypothetical protein
MMGAAETPPGPTGLAAWEGVAKLSAAARASTVRPRTGFRFILDLLEIRSIDKRRFGAPCKTVLDRATI